MVRAVAVQSLGDWVTADFVAMSSRGRRRSYERTLLNPETSRGAMADPGQPERRLPAEAT